MADPKELRFDVKYREFKPNFGNQYEDFQEEIEDQLPIDKMKELTITILCDSNHKTIEEHENPSPVLLCL